MNSNNLKLVTATISGLAIIILLFIQIATAETATKTEVALFSVLQFLFSIVISWVLTSLSSEEAFRDSQKKFAIAAFRRIKEIERALSRAQRLVFSSKTLSTSHSSLTTQAVMVSLMSAQDAVNSSIADWGDVIGDEIHLTKELEKLRAMRKASDKFERDYLDNLRRSDGSTDLDPQIGKLKKALPPSLKIEENTEDDQLFERAIQMLDQNLHEEESIRFDGFWESDDSFADDPTDLKIGDTIYIARGFTEGRGNSLLAYKKNGKWIGVITNIFIDHDIGLDYDSFVETVENHLSLNLTPPQFGGEMVPVTVIELEPKDEENSRQYFKVVLHMHTILQQRKAFELKYA